MQLPPAFVNRMQQQLAEQWDDFRTALEKTPPTSIRFNPAKKVSHYADLPLQKRVQWANEAYFLAHRPLFTTDPLFHAGSYYVQEAASMLIQQTLPQTDSPLKVLDLCAAPGGKSLLLYDRLPAGSILIANEFVAKRALILRDNLTRWGAEAVIVTQADPNALSKWGAVFDYILVDAPCSGEGLWRKQPTAIKEWSEKAIQQCALRQQQMLTAAEKLLKPGGRLVYSTCTFSPQENTIPQQLFPAWKNITEKLNFDPQWGLCAVFGGLQAYPHKFEGEGFFLTVLEKPINSINPAPAADHFKLTNILKDKNGYQLARQIRKPEEYIFVSINESVHALPHSLPAAYSACTQLKGVRLLKVGVRIGTLKGKDFIPDNELIYSQLLHPQALPEITLNLPQALNYLRGGDPGLRELVGTNHLRGLFKVSYQDLPLGMLKGVGTRANNLLPDTFRIHHL